MVRTPAPGPGWPVHYFGPGLLFCFSLVTQCTVCYMQIEPFNCCFYLKLSEAVISGVSLIEPFGSTSKEHWNCRESPHLSDPRRLPCTTHISNAQYTTQTPPLARPTHSGVNMITFGQSPLRRLILVLVYNLGFLLVSRH